MEHIRTPKVENVKLMDKYNPKASPTGNLYLTTSHLIFIEDKLNKETWILHMLMSAIEKPMLTTSGSQLKISCSNFQTVTFTIQRDKDAHDIYQSLLELSKPKDVQDLYCFSYNPKGELTQSTGWYFHDLQAEFQRQGVPNENWVTCSLNLNYKLCPTYPKYVYVPSLANKETIDGSAKFRSKGRLPVLTYLHSNGAAIIRCAQPLVGMAGLRSQHDEHYVECLRRATPAGVLTRGGGGGSDTIAPNIQIIDTRPAMNAMANKAGGKGYESDKYYENINFSFKGIENIHKMRGSLKELINTVTAVPVGGGGASIEMFMTGLANSGWLKHVKAVLDVSIAIADCILSNRSVIVHCSDGWDRTSQTCALACLMLDGYYRTIQGFQALIEKDWLSFGHKFQDRCGHIQGDPQEVSPTFIQFLDCVWQLTQLYPQAFQFNERYLITIEEHVYSCQYGTFIGNCERQREDLQLKQKTYSLWGYLAVSFSTEDQFVNPLYDKENKELTNQILRPKIVPQNIKFWRELYCRFERGAQTREPLLDLLAITQNHTTSLEDHGRQLTKTINYYTQKINVAKSASGVLKSMGLNSPSNASASPSNSKEKRNSVADSNTSNVSVRGASSTLVSPSKAIYVDKNDDNTTGETENRTDQVSPSISIGEEALNSSAELRSDNANSSIRTHELVKNASKLKDGENPNQLLSTNQTFCDPLLRRESEAESTTTTQSLGMPKIKDMNISKVVEKCQSST